MATRRTRQVVPPSRAVAFYGRTNQHSPEEPTRIARQYHQCLDAVAGRGVISHIYYDMQHPRCGIHPSYLARRVAEVGGPERRDGGWFDLLDTLNDQPDFTTIVIDEPSRISRHVSMTLDFHDLAAEHGVRVHYACDGPLTAVATPTPQLQLATQLGLAGREQDRVASQALEREMS